MDPVTFAAIAGILTQLVKSGIEIAKAAGATDEQLEQLRAEVNAKADPSDARFDARLDEVNARIRRGG